MGRFNGLLEVENKLNVDCGTSVFNIAHTRGKTLFFLPVGPNMRAAVKPTVIEFGSSIKLSKLIEIGEQLFVSSSNYCESYLNEDDEH